MAITSTLMVDRISWHTLPFRNKWLSIFCMGSGVVREQRFLSLLIDVWLCKYRLSIQPVI